MSSALATARGERAPPARHDIGIKRLWCSLPRSGRAFLVIAAVQGVVAGVVAATQIQEGLQQSLLVISTSILLWWMSLESLTRPCAAHFMACLVLAGLELSALATAAAVEGSAFAAAAIVCSILLFISILLCWQSYLQVGWRGESGLPGDWRLRGAGLRRALLRSEVTLSAIARLDGAVLTILCVEMISEGGRSSSIGISSRVALIVAGATSLPLVLAWLAVAVWAAKRALSRPALTVDFLYPTGLVAPVLALALPASGSIPTLEGAAARLCICGLGFLGTQAAMWWCLRLVWRAREGLRDDGPEDLARPLLFPGLLPLVQGAWVLKQSRRSLRSRRWVFAQLSRDASTLRWGWRSYVSLYMVESVAMDRGSRKLTLEFALDKPLSFVFESEEQLVSWSRALQELLPQLEAFEHVNNAARSASKEGVVMFVPGSRKGVMETAELSPERSSVSLDIRAGSDPRMPSLLWRTTSDTALARTQPDSSPPSSSEQQPASRGRLAMGSWLRNVRGAIGEAGAAMRKKRRNSPTKQPLVDGWPVHSEEEGAAAVGDSDGQEGAAAASGAGLHHRRHGVSSPRSAVGSPTGGAASFEAAWASIRSGSSSDSTADGASGSPDTSRQPDNRRQLEAAQSLVLPTEQTINVNQRRRHRLAATSFAFPASSESSTPCSPQYVSSSSALNPKRAWSPGQAVELGTMRPPPAPRAGIPLARSTSLAVARTLPASPSTTSPESSQTHRSPLRRGHSSLSPRRSLGADPANVVRYEDLRFGRLLGEGSEGAVYAGWLAETPVAVKRVPSAAELDAHLHATTPGHDNVVALRGWCLYGGSVYLVLELCPRGTMAELVHHSAMININNRGSSSLTPASSISSLGTTSAVLDPGRLVGMARGIARGVLHLHTRHPPLCHRDIKLSNILLGPGGVPKLADFGMSLIVQDEEKRELGATTGRNPEAQQGTTISSTPSTPSTPPASTTTRVPMTLVARDHVIGTAAYTAPEVLEHGWPIAGELALKADVYAYGVTLWELVTRRRPHAGMDAYQIQTAWMLDPASMVLPAPSLDGMDDPDAILTVQILWDLIKACTALDPWQRPDMRGVLERLRASAPGGSPCNPSTPLVNPI